MCVYVCLIGECNLSRWDDFDEWPCELGVPLVFANIFFRLGDTNPQRKRGQCEPAANHEVPGKTLFLNNKRKTSPDLYLVVSYVMSLIYSLDGKTHIIPTQLSMK